MGSSHWLLQGVTPPFEDERFADAAFVEHAFGTSQGGIGGNAAMATVVREEDYKGVLVRASSSSLARTLPKLSSMLSTIAA